jgi:hypothetical protein
VIVKIYRTLPIRPFLENGRPDKVTVDRSGSNKAALDFINDHALKEEQVKIR